ncbi:hypothetical protein G5I_13425 [Acromyrmex echinatior]|uniref:Uncharacterized protein n=1 Tax=Acromyrmex echinatior TaxID=103372 RepID=F4X502_ACREC|nr:hypothetical protein G5I_13425 [Acromyrmex echinatior]
MISETAEGVVRDERKIRSTPTRVSHADLTTVVLDAAARTAFPATRPEAQRRMQPRRQRAKKNENIEKPLFLLFG